MSVAPALGMIMGVLGIFGVVVRVRPLLPKEIAANASSCVENEANMVHLPSSQKTFT